MRWHWDTHLSGEEQKFSGLKHWSETQTLHTENTGRSPLLWSLTKNHPVSNHLTILNKTVLCQKTGCCENQRANVSPVPQPRLQTAHCHSQRRDLWGALCTPRQVTSVLRRDSSGVRNPPTRVSTTGGWRSERFPHSALKLWSLLVNSYHTSIHGGSKDDELKSTLQPHDRRAVITFVIKDYVSISAVAFKCCLVQMQSTNGSTHSPESCPPSPGPRHSGAVATDPSVVRWSLHDGSQDERFKCTK